ncbi:MAG: response regulator [Candidatus Riflebacteria bacterium]|nr:response regulator [Candidatus Riflebacteria bacterium]
MTDQKAVALFVDDRKENILALTAALGDMPMEIRTASSGQEALEILRKIDVAVILLDVSMPIMDGFETAALIRGLEKNQKTPIILLTAACLSETDFSRGFALGAVDYLTKPFSTDALKAKLQFFIDLFLQERQLEKAMIGFSRSAKGQITILLVDDDLRNLQTMKAVMDDLGEHILTVNSGREALSILLHTPVDLLIADVKMPEMDGFELVRLVKSNDRFQNLPIILVTAVKAAREDIALGYSLGVIHYILSPYPPEIFKAKVSNLIEFIRQKKSLAENVRIISELNRDLSAEHASLTEFNRQLNKDVSAKSEKLEIQEAQFQSLVDVLPGFVWGLSKCAQRSFFSRQVLDITGYSPDDLKDQNLFSDSIHPEDRQFVEENVHRLASLNKSYSIRYRFRHKNGHWLWLNELANNIDVKHVNIDIQHFHVLHAVGVTFDITLQIEKEVKERQDDRLKTIGLYSGGIAHDFNNLLGIIQGNIDLISQQSGNENSLDCVSAIQKATNSAAIMVRQMQNILKGSSSCKTMVQIGKIIQEAIPLFNAIAKKEVRFEFHTEAIHDTCLADPVQIQQVLLNLVKNGLQAMDSLESGVLRIELSEHFSNEDPSRQSEKSSFIRLSVCDSGPGFDTEAKAHLFEPFRTTKGWRGGTGLGLYMVKTIVQDHGGWIETESIPGKGASFHVFFPLAK